MYNSYFTINFKEIAYRRISENSYIIFHLCSKEAFILDNVATKIWESLFRPTAIKNIIAMLRQIYSGTDIKIIQQDTINFISQLYNKGFIIKNGVTSHARISNSGDWEKLLLNSAIRDFVDKEKLCLSAICEITQKCNLRCVHCYIPKQPNRELSLFDLNKIFNDLTEIGCISLILTGGEVFARNDILDILKIARNYNFAITLLTNGSLIPHGIIAELKDLQLLNIGVTLYGANESTYNKITGHGLIFKKIINTLELLVKEKLPVSLRFMVMKENLHDVDNFLSICKNLDLTPSIDFRIFPKFNGDIGPLNHRLEINEIARLIDKGKIEKPMGVVCKPCCYSCRISADGEVYPCSTLNISLGNVLKRKFKEIWLSDNAYLFRNQALTPNECMGCQLHKDKKCLNCPGVALLEEKSLERVSQFLCALSKNLFGK